MYLVAAFLLSAPCLHFLDPAMQQPDFALSQNRDTRVEKPAAVARFMSLCPDAVL